MRCVAVGRVLAAASGFQGFVPRGVTCIAARSGRRPLASGLVHRLLLVVVLSMDNKSVIAQSSTDSAFAAVQDRGAQVMGVDQSTSQHVFQDLPDGGRIVLVREDTADAAGTAAIRTHLRAVADSFARGIFSDPARVHARDIPGTADLGRLRDRIHYAVTDKAGGGELRITTTDPAAIAALRRFLRFQREDHHAAGHEEMPYSQTP